MPKTGLFLSDVKVNFKFRDFILDFLACLVPGLIFTLFITILLGGLLILFSYICLSQFNWSGLTQSNTLSSIISSFSFQLWLSFFVICISYFTGHLLYRQTPKLPDYASFIRIRNKVVTDKDDWVVPKGQGVVKDEVQFPYSNLHKYLQERGFDYLASLTHSEGEDKNKQRSKTLINQMKIRISIFYSDQALHIIRNEAHIRLFSSMWYAAKYIIRVAYYCNATLLILLAACLLYGEVSSAVARKLSLSQAVSSIELNTFVYIASLLASFAALIIGVHSKGQARARMAEWKQSKNGLQKEHSAAEGIQRRHDALEEKAKLFSAQILREFNRYDRSPLISSLLILIGVSLLLLFSLDKIELSSLSFLKAATLYMVIQIFIYLGALFAKHRIEDSIHYQRIREIFFVLETAYLTKLYKNIEKLPDLSQGAVNYLRIDFGPEPDTAQKARNDSEGHETQPRQEV